jgi:hypothetical protein
MIDNGSNAQPDTSVCLLASHDARLLRCRADIVQDCLLPRRRTTLMLAAAWHCFQAGPA